MFGWYWKLAGVTGPHLILTAPEGKTNSEIAHWLNLSEKTVGNHVSAILDKLGVTNRIEAATYAVCHHIERFRPGK